MTTAPANESTTPHDYHYSDYVVLTWAMIKALFEDCFETLTEIDNKLN